MTPSSIQAIAAQEATARELSMSPKLRDYVAKPCPDFLPGHRIPVPGYFGFDELLSVKWIEGFGWKYEWSSDAEYAAEKRMLEMNRARLAA